MNLDELLRLLNRIYVYLPSYLSIKKEVKNIIDQIKNSKEKLPPIEIVSSPEVSDDKVVIYDTQDQIKQS